MITSKVISGEQLVIKAATKNASTLPEVGLKDVIPNRSWLEQKQIQAALEARKHLIEIERIEKSGSLSHAEWQEDLMMAKVTKKAGSYWQYLGHNIGKDTFLHPEEAMFLIEINSLQLKHKGVTVSLQQAYTLLLRGESSLITYKVYSYFSRLGFKVFRHESSKIQEETNLVTCQNLSDNNCEANVTESSEINITKEIINESEMESAPDVENCIEEKRDDCHENSTASGADDTISEKTAEAELIRNSTEKEKRLYSHISNYNKLQYFENRISNHENLQRSNNLFENFPDLLKKNVINVKAPVVKYLPKNIVTKTEYVLNLHNVSHKKTSSPPSESSLQSETDEVNGDHIRRVRRSSPSPTQNVCFNAGFPNFFHNNRFTRPNLPPHFRAFYFWRPQTNYQFSFFYPRPFFSNFNNFNPRFTFPPRIHPFYGQFSNFNNSPNNPNINMNNTYTQRQNNRKRKLILRRHRLDQIKTIVQEIKSLAASRYNVHIRALSKIIQTYNAQYGARLHITDQLDVLEDHTPVETVELDPEEPKSKRSKKEQDSNMYHDNLKRIKELAMKVKTLKDKNESCAVHKRALTKLIKTFNQSYNCDIYMNSNFEILDRTHITLDSSDSDCIVEEIPEKKVVSKKVKNPFNVLKKLSEKRNLIDKNIPSTSKQSDMTMSVNVSSHNDDSNYESLLNIFGKNWLPEINDFGRAEVSPKIYMYSRLMDCKKEQLYNFTDYERDCNSWLQLKVSFWKRLTEAADVINIDCEENSFGINSIIKSEDCTDMPAVLKKLRIIETSNKVSNISALNVNFDVYKRDVQNFKKTNRPKAHFRIVCIDETTRFPSGEDIAALHSRNIDNVTIIFAVVGIGSIVYLQMNNTDLPVYVPGSSDTL